MVKDERVVYGSYGNPDKTVAAIRELQDKGYGKDEITLYSNTDRSRSFDKTDRTVDEKDEPRDRSFDKVDGNRDEAEGEDRSFDRVDKPSNDKEDDESMWDQVKDMFTRDTYDYKADSKEQDYSEEDDILYPHRTNIVDGHHIIVLDNKGRDQI